MKKRVEGDDAVAIDQLGCDYRDGDVGLRQDYDKANELWLRAGELGQATAYTNLGVAYAKGEGVEKNMKKAKYYFELAAMGGDVNARYKLGMFEMLEEGNYNNRAVKHWMISAGAGHDESLSEIRECFMDGCATKNDFEKALRAHKDAADKMRSEQREEVAALLAAGL